jgi:hypothetical protein
LISFLALALRTASMIDREIVPSPSTSMRRGLGDFSCGQARFGTRRQTSIIMQPRTILLSISIPPISWQRGK